MQQTLLLKDRDPEIVHAVPFRSASHTVCGVAIRESDDKLWNEQSISCPACLSVIINRIADEYEYYGRQNPLIIASLKEK